jgi:transcriptional regulator with XRE-family HTH domain
MAIHWETMITSPPLYDFVMGHLKARSIPQRRVARESGVPFSTVCKIAQGSVKQPSVHTVQRLADYFARVAGQESTATEQERAA